MMRSIEMRCFLITLFNSAIWILTSLCNHWIGFHWIDTIGLSLIFPLFYLPIEWGLLSVGLLGILVDGLKDHCFGLSSVFLMSILLLGMFIKRLFYAENDVQCLFLALLLNSSWMMVDALSELHLFGIMEAFFTLGLRFLCSQGILLLVGMFIFKLQRRFLHSFLGNGWERMKHSSHV